MIATCEHPSPLDQWRNRLGGRRYRHTEPRPLAALGYRANGPVIDGLVEVENLDIILLYDVQLRPGHCALRLAGYSGSRIPWGVRFGGPENCLYHKDLRLQPVPGGRGYRLDLADDDLLTLGLGLERELDRCARYCQQRVREHVCLPKFWAAFRPADTRNITGDGPELAAYAARTGRSPQHLLQHLRRDQFGLAMYPLGWVSHLWEMAVAVFADLSGVPRRQVFRLHHAPDDLVGFRGACEYDFYHGQARPTLQNKEKQDCLRSPAVWHCN
jgi:hypothetical protein